MQSSQPLYDDGKYVITAAVISTPQRLYPIANSTARIRRDPLWLALFLTAFIVAAAMIYGDLLYPQELLIGFSIAVASLLIGLNVRILSLDAFGHPRAFIFGRPKKVRALFRAITLARTADFSASMLPIATPTMMREISGK